MTSFDGESPLEVTITQGRICEARPNFTCTADITASTIRARVEFRDRPFGGMLIASFATTGHSGDVAADGTITITQIGADVEHQIWTYEAYCVLPSEVTQDLNPADFVNETTGALQQAGWGDLKVWEPSVQSGEPFDCGKFRVLIEPEVTE